MNLNLMMCVGLTHVDRCNKIQPFLHVSGYLRRFAYWIHTNADGGVKPLKAPLSGIIILALKHYKL